MRVIIAGSRSFQDDPNIQKYVEDAVKQAGFDITEVVSGGARGIDQAGEVWAGIHSIPVKQFLANWNDLSQPDAIIKTNWNGVEYDSGAGFRRNKQMAEYADALIAIKTTFKKSSGTNNMIDNMQLIDKPTFIFRI